MLEIKALKNMYSTVQKSVSSWASRNHFRLILFNMIVIMLFLLHSVGYFAPFFPITINFIVLLCLIVSILIFRSGSKFFFSISILFWILATIFRFLQVDAWVERTTIYVFQSLIIGLVLLLTEVLHEK